MAMELQALRVPAPILCLPLYPGIPTYKQRLTKAKQSKSKIQQRDAMKAMKNGNFLIQYTQILYQNLIFLIKLS
jgi:hypothetical protein